jgi:hypothetical protein
MARIENQPKVILTQEERETLRKAQRIIVELGTSDCEDEIFCKCDNDESEWYWIDTFIEKLVNISERE